MQVRCVDPQAIFDTLLSAGIVVRDLRMMPGLSDALRISVGTPAQNSQVLDIVAALSQQAGAAA